MKLSPLQKYILKQCLGSKNFLISKLNIYRFYNDKTIKPKIRDLISIVTKSVERLIKKDLLVGFGKKTAQKWFIQQVKLTPRGGKIARSLLGIQQKLPFKIKQK